MMTPYKNIFLVFTLLSLLLLSSCGFYRIMVLQKTFFINQPLSIKNFKEEIKFRLDKWIYINAKVNTEENNREFALDTGSPSFISFEMKDELKIKSKKVMKIGDMRMDYCTLTTKIGNLNYENAKYMVLDYGTPRLIGVNIMQNCIWSFNFRDSVITITDNLDFIKEVTDEYKMPFKPHSDQKTPVIKLVVNHTDTIEGFIDTGYPGYIKSNEKFNTDKINSDNVVISVYNENKFGKKLKKDSLTKSFDVKINSLSVGDFEIKNTTMIKDNSYKGSNLIGLAFLKNFIITIDWLNSNIYLKPIDSKNFRSNIATYGFSCYLDSITLKVTSVYINSPAARQGIQSGDEIATINNVEIKSIDKNIIGLINNIEPADTEINLTIKNKVGNIRLTKYSIFQ